MKIENDLRGNLFQKGSTGYWVQISVDKKVELAKQCYKEDIMVYTISKGKASVKQKHGDEHDKIFLEKGGEIESVIVQPGVIHWVELKAGSEMIVYKLQNPLDERR